MAIFADFGDDEQPLNDGSVAVFVNAHQASEVGMKGLSTRPVASANNGGNINDGLAGLAITGYQLLDRRSQDEPGLDSDRDVKITEHSPPPFSGLFACFPIVAAITARLDLNDLDSLSRSSHQLRVNLLQFRSHIITRTLHCGNDHGASAACARDLVRVCRRAACPEIVCRNCGSGNNRHLRRILHPEVLKRRLRRLCPSCLEASLPQLHPPSQHHTNPPHREAYCECGGLFRGFCYPCSLSMGDDHKKYLKCHHDLTRYKASLRARVSQTGAHPEMCHNGPRYDGISCARGQHCLAARPETLSSNSEADDRNEAPELNVAGEYLQAYTTNELSLGSNKPTSATPPLRECAVGASIDEADHLVTSIPEPLPSGMQYSDIFLRPEKEGLVRAWCTWCDRIVPSTEDRKTWKLA